MRKIDILKQELEARINPVEEEELDFAERLCEGLKEYPGCDESISIRAILGSSRYQKTMRDIEKPTAQYLKDVLMYRMSRQDGILRFSTKEDISQAVDRTIREICLTRPPAGEILASRRGRERPRKRRRPEKSCIRHDTNA